MPAVELTDVKISGFAAQNVKKGETFPLLVRASLTSDQPEFYLYMKSMSNLISSKATTAGVTLFLDRISSLFLVIHPDDSAHLYLQDFPIIAEIMAKRDVVAGQAVRSSDIADIRRLKFPDVDFDKNDKILICFKVGWKFALFFDLGEQRDLDTDNVETTLGSLYRHLQFQDTYEALSNEKLFSEIVSAGWFPFIELLGGDFDGILAAHKAQFGIAEQEEKLLARFDAERIDGIAARWWRHPILGTRRAILEPALEAYKRQDFVPCLKIILTEIEGIIRDAHIADVGSSANIKDLLRYAADQGVKKTGHEMSLFFPREFLKYMSDYTFARFDPLKPRGDVLSRHSTGHGGASAEAYTPVRALQAILTLDQIRFYL